MFTWIRIDVGCMLYRASEITARCNVKNKCEKCGRLACAAGAHSCVPAQAPRAHARPRIDAIRPREKRYAQIKLRTRKLKTLAGRSPRAPAGHHCAHLVWWWNGTFRNAKLLLQLQFRRWDAGLTSLLGEHLAGVVVLRPLHALFLLHALHALHTLHALLRALHALLGLQPLLGALLWPPGLLHHAATAAHAQQ